MIETIGLFVLVAAASAAVGVLIGRYYVPDDRGVRRAAAHGQSYLAALNALLARDRDEAIDRLRGVVEDDVNDVQPYFALAALFRTRGEWERAIRVHQAIALRADRDEDKRQALFELGLDFRSAGMPRRATAAMEECLRSDPGHRRALRALAGLYEEQERYAEAAEAWQRLLKIEGRAPFPRLMHLYAASAEGLLDSGDRRSARELLDRALEVDADSPHVRAVAARLAHANGDRESTRRHLQAAITANPAIAGAFLELLVESFGGAEQMPRVVEFLEGLAADLDEPSQLVRALIDLDSRCAGEGRAGLAARVEHGVDADVVAAMLAGRQALDQGDPEVIATALRRLVQPDGELGRLTEKSWHCSNCYEAQDAFFWRCHGCRHWGTATLYGSLLGQPSGGRERRQFARRGSSGSSLDGAKARVGRSVGAVRGWWSRLRS